VNAIERQKRIETVRHRGIALENGEEYPMTKTLSLAVGIAALVVAGTASAGGPVRLTNAQMDAVTAGASSSKSFDFTKSLKSTSDNNVNFSGKTKITDDFTKTADINIKSNVKGNSASLAFDNEAVGKNSNTQGSFSQLSVAGQGSSQSGLFVSAANGTVRSSKN